MANFKMIGNDLRDRSGNRIAYIQGSEIRERSGNTVGRVQNNEIRDRSGNRVASASWRWLTRSVISRPG